MARYDQPFSIIRRSDSRFYYFKLSRWDQYRSTGTTSLDEAERIAEAAYLDSLTLTSDSHAAISIAMIW
jgi:hypothetical protein